MPPPSIIPVEITREPDFLLEQTDHEILITGTEFALPAVDPSSWAQRDLTIRAYRVTLTEDLVLPGRSLTIACHVLEAAVPLTLSVSGRDGHPHRVAAKNGHEPGAHGSAGLPGDDGQDAGKITLVLDRLEGGPLILKANGGHGASGQKGGDGQKGRGGGAGGDAVQQAFRDWIPGERGGDGGPGGDAGAGGAGGRAGNGGAIMVLATEPIAEERLSTSAEPGNPGPRGARGNPGAGGDPGRGGRNLSCIHEPPFHH